MLSDRLDASRSEEPATEQPALRVLARCRVAVHLFAGVAAVIAGGALVGWTFDVAVLKSVVPGLVAMNPLTAVCFLACCVALELLRPGAHPRELRVFGTACAAFVTTIGLVRVVGSATGWNVGLDQILFADRLNVAAARNRMAPNTAFDFVVLGAALLFLRVELRRGIRPAEPMAFVAASTGFVALIGYVYSVASLTRIAAYIPMALHTALCFICLATAILCAVPERGLMRRLTGNTSGGRLLRSVVPAFIVVPPFVGWLRLQGELAGWYSSAFGAAIMVGAMIALGVVLAWINAASIDRAEGDRQRVEQATRRLAYFDGLTGLPNRMLFNDRLTNALARARREAGCVAVMFLDLDGFKRVNDRLGHAAGDDLLRQAAGRLTSAVRDCDTIARLAGDEFTAILVGIRTPADVDIAARRILDTLSKPYEIDGSVVEVSASMGVSVSPADGGDASVLTKKADVAMYCAKSGGKNGFMRYSPSMQRAIATAATTGGPLHHP